MGNGTLLFQLSQAAVLPGGYAIAPQTASCYTSTDGSVVGVPNPQVGPTGGAYTGIGTLPAGVYFVQIAYTDASGPTSTLVSPATLFTLTGSGELRINPPTLQPAAANGYAVYIGTGSGAETLQGTVTGFSSVYTQSTPLSTGAAAPSFNDTACALAFNDAMIPTATYYTVTLSDAAGNVLPGFPQNWYLAGGGAIVSDIIPLASNPAVRFPMPILANPPSDLAQSVNSPINLNGFPIQASGNVGPGFYGAFWSGSAPAAGTTLASWTPNSAVELRMIDVNAQSAGAGGTSGLTVTVSNGTSTCSFTGLLTAAAISTAAAPSDLGAGCSFNAGVPLTVKLSADDHTTEPQNLSWSIEMTAN